MPTAMPDSPPQHHVVYQNPDSYCGPIVVPVALPDGELLIAFREAKWRGFKTHADPTTRTTVLRSPDRGRTWRSPVSAHPAAGNGAAISRLSDDTLLCTGFQWIFADPAERGRLGDGPVMDTPRLGLVRANAGSFITRSDTAGYTWHPPEFVHVPGFAFASTAGRVVELPDGTLLMPMSGRQSEAANQSGAFVMRSADGGTSWTGPAIFAPAREDLGFVEPRLTVLPGGRVIAMARTAPGPFHQSHSDDGGHTWSPLRETDVPCDGSSPPDLLTLEDGRLLCTFGRRTEPFGVRARLSEDGGRTWPAAHEIVLRDDGPDRDMGYPGSVQLDATTVLTCYYWHEADEPPYIAATTWTLP